MNEKNLYHMKQAVCDEKFAGRIFLDPRDLLILLDTLNDRLEHFRVMARLSLHADAEGGTLYGVNLMCSSARMFDQEAYSDLMQEWLGELEYLLPILKKYEEYDLQTVLFVPDGTPIEWAEMDDDELETSYETVSLLAGKYEEDLDLDPDDYAVYTRADDREGDLRAALSTKHGKRRRSGAEIGSDTVKWLLEGAIKVQ